MSPAVTSWMQANPIFAFLIVIVLFTIALLAISVFAAIFIVPSEDNGCLPERNCRNCAHKNGISKNSNRCHECSKTDPYLPLWESDESTNNEKERAA